jgi:EmrB/QacA subfamily drug resistance transporter
MNTTAITQNEPQGTHSRDRWVALIVLCIGMLMIILDSTIVNVALPAIQDDLGFTQSSLAWVINAYLIAFGGLLLLAGRIGDLIGRKKIFLAGLALFTAASLACGLAQNEATLIVARFVQGVGGAMTAAVILGMIVRMFPEPAEQAKAIGVYSFVAAAGASIGLLLGGILTEAINWHWIFFVNIPIGVATAFFALRVIENDEGIGIREGADVSGAFLLVASLMLTVYTIIGATENGWGSTQTLLLAAATALLYGGFFTREHRAASPLVPLGVFRHRTISGANVAQALMVSGLFGMFFLGALFFQRVLGMDSIEVGLAFMPVALGIAIFSLTVSPRLIMRFGARATLIPGLSLIAIGLLFFRTVPADADYLTQIFPEVLLFGIGAGLSFPSVMTLAMASATAEDSGLISGLVNTTQQMGGAIGLAVLATLSASKTQDLLDTGASQNAALTSGFHLAFTVSAGFVIAGVLVAVFWLRPQEAQAAEAAQPEINASRTFSENDLEFDFFEDEAAEPEFARID